MTPRQAEARRLALDGLTLNEIAAEMGVTRQAVQQLLKATDTTARRSPGNCRPSPTPEEVVALYQEGLTDEDVARMFGISQYTVRDRRRKAGVKGCGGVPPRFTPTDVDRIVALHHEGWSQMKIAAEYGADQTTVSRTLRKRGIRQDRPPTDADRIIDLALKGMRQVDIAAEVGVSTGTVGATLRKNGLYRLNRKVRP